MEINSNIFERMMLVASQAGYKNANDLAKAMGYKSPEKLYRLDRDKNAKPSVDILTDFANLFENIDMHWVLTGKGQALNPDNLQTKEAYTPNATDHLTIVSDRESAYNAPATLKDFAPATAPATTVLVPQFITVDSQGVENILWVNVRASAGYVKGHADPEYLERLPSFNLPTLRGGGTYRTFEVDGDSMFPTLENKEAVVGRWVESFDDIIEDHVHIIVSKERGILIKRVLNRINKYGYLILKSDAVDNRNQYPNIEIPPDDVLEIWFAVVHLNNKFRHPTDMYKRINNLEADLTEVMRLLKSNKLVGDTREV